MTLSFDQCSATGKDRTYAGPIWRFSVILLLSLGFFPCHAQELLLDSGELNRTIFCSLRTCEP